MCKETKNFQFNHLFTKPVVKSGKIASEKLSVSVEVKAYAKPCLINEGELTYSVDIESVKYEGSEIKDVLSYFSLLEEIEAVALEMAPTFFVVHSDNTLMEKQLINTVELIKGMVGNDYLYFDKPVSIRPTEISYPFNAWAVCAGPDNKLYVMDSDEQWHPVEENLLGKQLIGLLEEKVKSIYQKMKKEIAA